MRRQRTCIDVRDAKQSQERMRRCRSTREKHGRLENVWTRKYIQCDNYGTMLNVIEKIKKHRRKKHENVGGKREVEEEGQPEEMKNSKQNRVQSKEK